MRSYQSVLILKPDIDEARVAEALEKIGEFIKSNGGACLKIENWGKKRLAYRVKKNRFGIYLNLYHTLESAKVSDLENKYKLYDLIIKYMCSGWRRMNWKEPSARKLKPRRRLPPFLPKWSSWVITGLI